MYGANRIRPYHVHAVFEFSKKEEGPVEPLLLHGTEPALFEKKGDKIPFFRLRLYGIRYCVSRRNKPHDVVGASRKGDRKTPKLKVADMDKAVLLKRYI